MHYSVLADNIHGAVKVDFSSVEDINMNIELRNLKKYELIIEESGEM